MSKKSPFQNVYSASRSVRMLYAMNGLCLSVWRYTSKNAFSFASANSLRRAKELQFLIFTFPFVVAISTVRTYVINSILDDDDDESLCLHACIFRAELVSDFVCLSAYQEVLFSLIKIRSTRTYVLRVHKYFSRFWTQKKSGSQQHFPRCSSSVRPSVRPSAAPQNQPHDTLIRQESRHLTIA